MKIIAFCCHNSLDDIEAVRRLKDTSIKVNLLPCSSKIEVGHLLSTFEQGIDGIMVVGCLKGKCQFEDGNILAKGRISYAGNLLSQIGLEQERIAFFSVSGEEEFLNATETMKEKLAALGPSPLNEENYEIRERYEKRGN